MKTITKALMAMLMIAASLFSVASPASAAVTGNDIAEVSDWYNETGNPGDTAGINYWAGRFDSHNDYDYDCNSSQGGDLNNTAWDMQGFLVGRGMNSKSNAQKVDWAYGVVLSRAPDSGGYSYWLSYLNNGGHWYNMVSAMTWSGEYYNLKMFNNSSSGTWDGAAQECVA